MAYIWKFTVVYALLAVVSAVFTNYTTLRGNGSAIYKPLFDKHSNSTPIFHNTTGHSANPLITALLSGNSFLEKRADDLPIGACAPGTPCSNGACCSNTGVCSYAPSSCGADVCISNCDAKAPCGQYADASNATCPLNVCCSQYGFCGSTDEYCGTGCQDGYGTCGPAPEPSCAGDSTSARRIGYYESWSATRGCDARAPEDLDLTGMTHINFAFAFFHPTTFQMMPMSAGDPELYTRFTALKAKKASLQCFISVGGWSFNDDTNVPNTRTAFSDMVGSADNRRTFIESLSQFLQTYNFDGVDLDWEYPAAGDRGGSAVDKANYVTFLQELRAAFGTRYGISATIPSSYWYLRGFDVVAMQDSLDWFNMMSYDIHGVWDSTNKFTGPYVRPHTNWTEINEGLDLLWRAGVDSSKVVLGLGWYGRSFTLSDPACTEPNGVCTFSQGGSPGSCTASAATLSNAEIFRIIAAGVSQQGFDQTAAVKWITWNSNQWVSYDDGETMQMKIANADKLCLGGIMIWSLDQDDAKGSSMNDLLGIGTANGVSAEEAARVKQQMDDATLAANIASSCYWTFCGETCTSGYFEATQSQGQVAGISRDSTCSGDDVQTLCCAPGTTLGKCAWEGWRGVGLPCTPACNDTSATIIARNTNHYYSDLSVNILEDQTCNGGYQAYCCNGFIPSTKTNTGNLALYGQGGLTKRQYGLAERGVGGAAVGAVAGSAACAAVVTVADIFLAFFTFGISLATEPAQVAACAAVGAAIGYIASGSGSGTGGTIQKPANVIPPKVPKTGKITPVKTYGQWTKATYPAVSSKTDCDCSVTYTCRYNVGGPGRDFDEICDNQKWAIDKGLHGARVYNYQPRGASNLYSMTDWKRQRVSFQASAQASVNNVARCQVDEFPMGSLEEARKTNPQYVRLVNGPANRRQGTDWKAWLNAIYKPCSSYRQTVCSTTTPKITWEIGEPTIGDNRLVAPSIGNHFVGKYGFDSQTANSLCYATFQYNSNNAIHTSTVSDHGFRVMTNDPLFTLYGWPVQNYKTNPANANGVYPQSVNSANWLKRQAVQSALLGDSAIKGPSHSSSRRGGPGEDDGTVDEVLCPDGGTAYADVETGELLCFDEDDMVDGGFVDDGAKNRGSHTVTVTTAAPDAYITAAAYQSRPRVRGTLPTETPSIPLTK